MPKRDYRVDVYVGRATQTAFGTTYAWDLTQSLWAEIIQKNVIPTLEQGSNTFASEFKVILQTPELPYSLELTRFVYTKRGRTFTLQPYRLEVVSGTRNEICLYTCKQVSGVE